VPGVLSAHAAPERANDQSVKIGGVVSGRLLKSNGRPRQYTELELVPVGATKQLNDMRLWAITNGRGNFRFKDVPNGSYTLSINFGERPSSTSPYSTVFYPNKESRVDARVFQVIDGSSFSGLRFQLPPSLPRKRLTGKVTWSNGKPIRNAYVSLVDLEYQMIAFGEIKTNSKGVFALTGFANREYQVHVLLFDSPKLKFNSKPLAKGKSDSFLLDNKTKPLKIVLKRIVEPLPQNVGMISDVDIRTRIKLTR